MVKAAAELQRKVTHFVYPAEDSPETGSEGIALLGEKGVARLCSFETELGVGEGHPRWENTLSRSSA